MAVIEVKRTELKVGDVLQTKGAPLQHLRIVAMAPGINGKHFPYLTLEATTGTTMEHDTSWDSLNATYSVLQPKKQKKEKNSGNDSTD